MRMCKLAVCQPTLMLLHTQDVRECTDEESLKELLNGASAVVEAITSTPGASGAPSATLARSSAPSNSPVIGMSPMSAVGKGTPLVRADSTGDTSGAAQSSSAGPEPAIAGLSLSSQPAKPHTASSASAAASVGSSTGPRPLPAPRTFFRAAASSGPRFVGRIAVQSLAGDTMPTVSTDSFL